MRMILGKSKTDQGEQSEPPFRSQIRSHLSAAPTSKARRPEPRASHREHDHTYPRGVGR